MKAIRVVAICAVVSGLVVAARADKMMKMQHPMAKAVFVNADEVKWGPAPPSFPKGGELAVLHGDPFKHEQYALRFKMPDGYTIMPHWHTKDEQLTILSGLFILHMGDTLNAPAHNLAPGAYHFLPGTMHHSAQAKGDVVLEIHGIGPFDIHYLNPADDPTKANMAASAATK
jgi:quercetin dioxygenase-like cupin family protein